MPTYEQNKASIKRYMDKQDEIRVRMSKKSGIKDAVQHHAEQTGESVNAFVIRAILETIERDSSPNIRLDGGIPQTFLAYERQRQQKTYEQRKAIIDATSYCGSNGNEKPVWKDREESKKAGE